jgi:hypothetical protein
MRCGGFRRAAGDAFRTRVGEEFMPTPAGGNESEGDRAAAQLADTLGPPAPSALPPDAAAGYRAHRQPENRAPPLADWPTASTDAWTRILGRAMTSRAAPTCCRSQRVWPGTSPPFPMFDVTCWRRKRRLICGDTMSKKCPAGCSGSGHPGPVSQDMLDCCLGRSRTEPLLALRACLLADC